MIRYFRIILSALSLLAAGEASFAQINTEQVIRSGRSAIFFEDYVLSIQYFNQAIAAKPYLAQPYFFRALAKLNLDDFNGARADANEAIARNPFLTDAYELRAVAFHNLGEPRRAIADYDKVLESLPENRGILFNKAMALQDLKDFDAAATVYDRLLKSHPGFDNGHVGRARLRLETGDTVGARSDADKALSINPQNVNARLIRADILINHDKDFNAALEDMNNAIRLQPRSPALFINRAFVRKNLDDFYGAIADYDYAAQLAPSDYVPYFNRAMLLMQLRDFDRALDDLDKVISLKGHEIRAIYNRAVVRNAKRDFKGALADINEVIATYPDLAAGFFMRSQIEHDMGNPEAAKRDYDKSIAMATTTVQLTPDRIEELGGKPRPADRNFSAASSGSGNSAGGSAAATDSETPVATESQDVVAARFSNLITVSQNPTLEQEFNNKQIRGRVQDRAAPVEIEPMFVATYYSSPTELRPNSEYMKEADEINRTRLLRFVLQVTNHEPSLNDPEEIKKHFESVEYYNSYISTHPKRAIDFFARGMDFMTLRNYPQAMADFTRAIETTPDFTLAYLMRAIATLRNHQAESAGAASTAAPSGIDPAGAVKKSAMADIDKTIELSPDMAVAHFNKGVLLLESGDWTSAITAFSRAIEIRPEFGEAYYNRGYAYFRLGNARNGSADLSQAGQLGVVPSYSLLKRMNH